MLKITKHVCVLSCIALAGCSSSSDSDNVPAGSADLQGSWASTCFADADNDSSHVQLLVQGSSLTISDTTYVNNTTCDGLASVSNNEFHTFALTGVETLLDGGNAKHVDLTFTNASVTASQGTEDLLTTLGTSLEAVLAADGIVFADINNITAAEINITNLVEYSLYRVDPTADGGVELRTGNTVGGLDSSTAALRPTTLDVDRRFNKVN